MNKTLMERPPKADAHMPGLMTRQAKAPEPELPAGGPMAPMTQRAAERHAKAAAAAATGAEPAPRSKAPPKRKVI